MYMLRSYVDPAKLLALHASRLVSYKDNLVYSCPASQVAASDYSEFVVDYITAHDGSPAHPDSLRFLVTWLGQSDDARVTMRLLGSHMIHSSLSKL